MAAVTVYVNTDNVSGTEDGTTRATGYTAGADASANLSSHYSAGDDVTILCSGATADAPWSAPAASPAWNTLTIEADRGAATGFYAGNNVIDTGYYHIDWTGSGESFASLLHVTAGGVTVDGIQFKYNGGANYTYGIKLGVQTTFTAKNCRGLGTGNNVAVSYMGIGYDTTAISPNWTFENNLIIGWAFCIYGGCSNFYTNNAYFRHNTLDYCAYGIYWTNNPGSGGTLHFEGNAVRADTEWMHIADTGTPTITYADNVASPAGGTTDEVALGTDTDAWTSPGSTAGSDFSVKDASSPLYQAVNPTVVTTDITDYTRDGTSHDAGAFEYQAGGGPPPPPPSPAYFEGGVGRGVMRGVMWGA